MAHVFTKEDEAFYTKPTDKKLISIGKEFSFFPNLWATDLSEYQKQLAIFRWERAASNGTLRELRDLADQGMLVDWLLREG